MLAPSYAWSYRCNLQGCCCGGWRITLREPDWQRLRAATDGTVLEDDFREGVRRTAEGPVPVDSPPALAARRYGDTVAMMDTSANGNCRFLAGGGRCRIHEALGEGSLPDICVAFPVSALRTPRGVECWFETVCPEVLRALVEAPEVAGVTEAPEGFLRQVRYFQYDEPVRWVALTDDRVTPFEDYDRFRADVLDALRAEADRPLAVLARAVAYAVRWATDGAVDRPFSRFRATGREVDAVMASLAERARETAVRTDLPDRLSMARRLLGPLPAAVAPLARLASGEALPPAGAALATVAAAGPDAVRVLANVLVAGVWATPLLSDDALAPGLLRLLRNVGTGLYLAGALAPGGRVDGAAMGVGLALGEFAFRGRTGAPPVLDLDPEEGARTRTTPDLPTLARLVAAPRPGTTRAAAGASRDPEAALREALRLRIAVTARSHRAAVRAALARPAPAVLDSPWDPPVDEDAVRCLAAQRAALGPRPMSDLPGSLRVLARLGLGEGEAALAMLLRETGRDAAWARAVAGATLDDDGGRPARESLAALFGPEAYRWLAPAGRLVALGLLHVRGDGPGARYALDGRVMAALDGALAVAPPVPLWIVAEGALPAGRVPAPAPVVEGVRARLDALAPGGGLLLLTGPGGLDPVEVLARAGGRPVVAVEVPDPGEDGDVSPDALGAVREALLRDAVPLWVLDGGAADRAAVGRAAERVAVLSGAPLALATPAWPEGLEGRVAAVEAPLPAPSVDHLAAVVARATPRDVRLGDAAAIRQALRGLPLRCDQVAAATASACQRVLARGEARPRLPLGVLVGEVRAQLRSRIGEFADVETGAHGLEDLVLPDDARERLREVLAAWRHREQVMEDWGLGRRVAGARGLSVLLYGPPGTGKTLAAGVLARELGLELFRVDLSRVVDKYVGETGKHLSRVFDEARRGQVLLLFDEADSLFGKRTAVASSTDRYANLEVNHLLQRLEGHDGLVVLTTNHEKNLDEAFLRRLRYRVRFPMPDRTERARLWQGLVPPEAPLVLPVDWEALGDAYEMSGGHIRNAVLRAAFRAAAAGVTLDDAGLRAAGDREYRDLGRLVRQETPGG